MCSRKSHAAAAVRRTGWGRETGEEMAVREARAEGVSAGGMARGGRAPGGAPDVGEIRIVLGLVS